MSLERTDSLVDGFLKLRIAESVPGSCARLTSRRSTIMKHVWTLPSHGAGNVAGVPALLCLKCDAKRCCLPSDLLCHSTLSV